MSTAPILRCHHHAHKRRGYELPSHSYNIFHVQEHVRVQVQVSTSTRYKYQVATHKSNHFFILTSYSSFSFTSPVSHCNYQLDMRCIYSNSNPAPSVPSSSNSTSNHAQIDARSSSSAHNGIDGDKSRMTCNILCTGRRSDGRARV